MNKVLKGRPSCISTTVEMWTCFNWTSLEDGVKLSNSNEIPNLFCHDSVFTQFNVNKLNL